MGTSQGVYVWCLVSILFLVIFINTIGTIIAVILWLIIGIGGAIIIGKLYNKADPTYKFNKMHSKSIGMICPACNTALPDGADVCPSCGRKI